MKKLSKKSYNEIRTWIYRNARPLELARWQYYFEGGSKDAVLSALSFYQNEDGGFGNALEPDCWNPNSSPYTTLIAIDKLNEMNITDTTHPIIKGIFNFLESGVHSGGCGWLFNIPSNDKYPHAPWWTYDPDANEYQSIGIAAGIACFILKFADNGSSIYKHALSIVKGLTDKLDGLENYGEMGVSGYCTLMNMIPRLGLADKFDMELLSTIVYDSVNSSIERDDSKWKFYNKRPSAFITSPESVFFKGNEDIIQKELDWLIDTRHENGVWDITWSWFENNEKYPKEFAISENWWKAENAISRLEFLRNFDRLE